MFILERWNDNKIIGYRFGDKTYYGTRHLGVDHIVPIGTPVYAPGDGKIIAQYTGTQGGKTLIFKANGSNHYYRFLHLSEYNASGNVRGGQIIAYTGNTGSYTKGPHLHTDLPVTIKGDFWKDINNFIDPMSKEDDMPMPEELLRDNVYQFNNYRDKDVFLKIPSAPAGDKYLTGWGKYIQRVTIPKAIQIKEVIKEIEKRIEVKVPVEVIKEVEKVLTPQDKEKIAVGWLKGLLGRLWDGVVEWFSKRPYIDPPSDKVDKELNKEKDEQK